MKPKAPSVNASSPTILNDVPGEDNPLALVGRVIADRYEIQELLGVGGMGAVYRARHIHIRKQVALKTLHPSMLRSPEAIARFEREAIAAARIDHPNVVVATDFGPLPDGRYYLVLEFVEGRDLRHTIDHERPLPVRRAISIARQITAALVAAHSHEIVHRDLKPENVMLVRPDTEGELVKVLDFGIAKITLEGKNQPLTQMGAVFGTPQYMSPEQAKGLDVDGRSDLYSLGIILYEMLTGHLPFDAPDALGYLLHHLGTEPAPLPAQLPAQLRALVSNLLQKEPEKRIGTAAELLLELERLAQTIPAEPTVLTSPFRPLQLMKLRGLLTHQKAFWLARKRVGRLTLPLLVWTLVPISVLAVGVSFFPAAKPVGERLHSATGEAPKATVPGSNLPTQTDVQFTKDIERIEQLKVYQRTELDWMILSRGTAQLGQYEKSVLAYQALLSLRRDLKKDPQLLADILRAAQDPKAFRVALNLSETILGKPGVDLIWDLWEDEKYLPDHKEQTDKLAKKLVILSRRATPALRVAIDLTFTNQCDKLLGILARAATEADTRSVARLTELGSKVGCGAGQAEDCYACLRDDPLLGQALEKAKKTPAPALGQTIDD